MAYNPQNGLALNKAPSVVGAIPDSGKNYYYVGSPFFIYRPFQSVSEATSAFTLAQRNPTFEVYINTSTFDSTTQTFSDASAIEVYWFQDSVNLTLKLADVASALAAAEAYADAGDATTLTSAKSVAVIVSGSQDVTSTAVDSLVFTLPVTINEDSFILYVGDSLIKPTEYTISGTTVTITSYEFTIGVVYPIYYKYQKLN